MSATTATEQPTKKRAVEDERDGSPSPVAKANDDDENDKKKMYLVLFVTDYRKEHDFRAHKIFARKEDAIAEAKRFTTPPEDGKDGFDEDDENMNRPFQWEYTCPSRSRVFEGRCRNNNIEGVTGMSWTPVVTVVEVDAE